MSDCLSIFAGQKAKQSQVKLFLVSLENLQDLTIEFKSASETLIPLTSWTVGWAWLFPICWRRDNHTFISSCLSKKRFLRAPWFQDVFVESKIKYTSDVLIHMAMGQFQPWCNALEWGCLPSSHFTLRFCTWLPSHL